MHRYMAKAKVLNHADKSYNLSIYIYVYIYTYIAEASAPIASASS